MFELMLLPLGAVFITMVILPWVNFAQSQRLKRRIALLEARIYQLTEDSQRQQSHPSEAAPTAETKTATQTEPASAAKDGSTTPPPLKPRVSTSIPAPAQPLPPPKHPPVMPVTHKAAAMEAARPTGVSARAFTAGSAPAETDDKGETDWFAKLAIWVGGAALLMAGFFMVKYSLEEGFLTPAVRIILTFVFGGLLCAAGFVIRPDRVLAGTLAMGQALAGAGLACLYFAVYGCVHLYGFFDERVGFGAMLVVTLLAIVLSLRNGAPIALMGLIGGFLTPLLMGSEQANTVFLFTYLFILYAGCQALFIWRRWAILSVLAVALSYLWSGALILGAISGLWMAGLAGAFAFILGICFVNALWWVLMGEERASGLPSQVRFLVNAFVWVGAFAQAFALLLWGGFAWEDQLFFAILALGALALGMIREASFFPISLLGFAALTLGNLANAERSDPWYFFAAFALPVVFAIAAFWKQSRGGIRQTGWQALTCLALFSAVPVAYANREWLNSDGMASFGLSYFWLWAALAFVGLTLALAEIALRRKESDREAGSALSLVASWTLALGLLMSLTEGALQCGIPVLFAAAAFYWMRRQLAHANATILSFGVLTLVLFRSELFLGIEFLFGPIPVNAVPDATGIGAYLLAFIAFISALFTAVSVNLRRALKASMAFIGVLGIALGYAVVAVLCLGEEPLQAGLDGGMTALWAVIAGVAGTFLLRGSAAAGVLVWVAAGVVLARLWLVHLTAFAPLGELVFWNALLLQLGIPLVVAIWLSCAFARAGRAPEGGIFQIAAMLLAWLWLTFSIRHYFQGEMLRGSMSDAELYTYSIGWVLLGVAFQLAGLRWRVKALHVGSLVLLLITVGKVFLVDAAQLTGLYRVLSFLGLGICLLGIGYFYNRVVFRRRGEE